MKKENLIKIITQLLEEVESSETEEFYVDMTNKQEMNTITWGVIQNHKKK